MNPKGGQLIDQSHPVEHQRVEKVRTKLSKSIGQIRTLSNTTSLKSACAMREYDAEIAPNGSAKRTRELRQNSGNVRKPGESRSNSSQNSELCVKSSQNSPRIQRSVELKNIALNVFR